MKRYFYLLLVVMLLITGCKGETVEQDLPEIKEPQEVIEQEAEEPISSEEEEPASWMDMKQDISETGNLFYVPNDTIEQVAYPNLYGVGGNFLVVSYPDYVESDGMLGEQSVDLYIISMEDGSKLYETSVPAVTAGVQVIDDQIVVCDNMLGTVTILDEKLNLLENYVLEGNEMDTWHVGDDLKSLYICNWDEGFYVADLETGERHKAIDTAMNPYMNSDVQGNIFCHYTDMSTLINNSVCVNTETGEMEPVPMEEDLGFTVSKNEDVWLVSSKNDLLKYYLCTSDGCKVIPYDGIQLSVFGDQILAVDINEISLYDMEGNNKSNVIYEGSEMAFLENKFVWSEEWNGYFLLELGENTSRLLFWSQDECAAEEKLTILEEEHVRGTAVSEALYQRANELSERFGVEIHIADQCEESYMEYTCSYETDEDYIGWALDTLETCMMHYPEGFFEQLRYGDLGPMTIALVTNLQRDDGIPPSAAFAWDNCIVMDTALVTDMDFYHEVGHLIDNRLFFANNLFGETTFDEAAWMTYQPEGFAYSYSYLDYEMLEVDYAYFVSQYSATFPTEDRAEMMDYAMRGSAVFKENEPLYKKLEYYSNCIRECFDTVGWPGITKWEEPLYQ